MVLRTTAANFSITSSHQEPHPVKSEFASAIEFVGNDSTMKRSVLLVTSTGTHVQMMPSLVSMNIINVQKVDNTSTLGMYPLR